jgi:anthranilate synthase component I
VAPTVRSFSAEFDPLRLIEQFPDCYPGILESGSRKSLEHAAAELDSDDSRFDILPIANGESLRLDGSGRLSGHRAGADGFLAALNGWCRELRSASADTTPPLPFRGGWLVYFSYEMAAEVEPMLRLPASGDALSALALRTPAAWVRDRRTGLSWLIAEESHESLLQRFEDHVTAIRALAQPPAAALDLRIEEEDPERFIERVRRALEYIAAGDIYQANLSRAWTADAAAAIDPVDLYRRLRGANPGPFCALLRFGDFAVVSSSPERLVVSDGRRVASRPIAGTRPRGADRAADAELVRQLLDNEKERAEHVMLIDLERNDLGRVCVGGSVVVDEFMSVESYAHVHHIVSNVSGLLRPDISVVDVLRAVFPGGTITGCPKFRCMQIIAELEGTGRGAYTGSLGYINTDGSADFNILIRTMSVNGSGLQFRAGAGIVADSDPARELAETRAKAEGLRRSLLTA